MSQSVLSKQQIRALIATAKNDRVKLQYEEILAKLEKDEHGAARSAKANSLSRSKTSLDSGFTEINPDYKSGQEILPIRSTPSLKGPPQKPPSKIKDRNRKKRVKENSDLLFKAVGLIKGTIEMDEGIFIQIGEQRFQIVHEKNTQPRTFTALFNDVRNNPGADFLLFCYPKPIYAQNGKIETIKFIPIHFKKDDGTPMEHDLEPFEFLLSGFWDKLSNQEEVISVFRNRNENLFESLKKMNPEEQKQYTKPRYLPVNWGQPPVPPYEHEKQNKQYFVEVLASFDPLTMKFQISQTSTEPTTESPLRQRYLRTPIAKKKKGGKDNKGKRSQTKVSRSNVRSERNLSSKTKKRPRISSK